VGLSKIKQANKKWRHEHKRKLVARVKKQRELDKKLKIKKLRKEWEKNYARTRQSEVEV